LKDLSLLPTCGTKFYRYESLVAGPNLVATGRATVFDS
jgi:hypothetical protein